MSKINEAGVRWWKVRFQQQGLADAFESALLELLPDGDWELYNDYDPDGILLEAVRKIGIECRGCFFSGDGLFPQKTGIKRKDGRLVAKEGYGGNFYEVPFK